MPAGPLAIPPLHRPPGRIAWKVPGSKSITNRAYVLAALSRDTVLHNVLESDDTRRMRECLDGFGVEVESLSDNRVRIRGGRERLRVPSRALFVGNSGTTVRFLAGLAALVPGATTFVGDQHMAKRPIADLVDGLRQLGIAVDCPTGCPPLTIHGGAVNGTRVTMNGERSSQYFTALLLAAGMFDVDLDITVEGTLVSRPYIDMTIAMVRAFGGAIDAGPDRFQVSGRRTYGITPDAATAAGGWVPSFAIEPDASSASYPFALAAAGGFAVQVVGLDHRSLQGDIGFTAVLARMGAVVEHHQHADGTDVPVPATVVGGPTGALRGIDVDMHHISDTVMTLAAIAPLCDGPTTIRNVANIRIKETDRLAATVAELRRLGQQVEHGDDWLRITPRPLRPATIECYNDHRMAMSFAVLAASARERHWDPTVPIGERLIRIADPACTAKTYPGFWDDLAKLYPRTPW
jgi:3-phosphoshikimate 1-carboxyvinyltransferase